MTERKYRFEAPRNSRQHLEALYEELSFSEREYNNSRPTETLKDHVAELLHEARVAKRQRKDEKEAEERDKSWAVSALAVLAAILMFVGMSRQGSWLDDYLFVIRLWAIGFAAVFVGVSIERSSFFTRLWAYGFTKLTASIAVSALVVFSTGKASSLINGVFPVDASALPFTRAIVAGLLAFEYAYPLLLVVAVFAAIHALVLFGWVKLKLSGEGKYNEPPIQSVAFLLLSAVVLMSYAKWVNRDFSNEAWPAKIYRLAHSLDFDVKYECTNIPKGFSVVFLGPDHAHVLLDQNNPQSEDIESFVDAGASEQTDIPQRFRVLLCEAETRLPDGEKGTGMSGISPADDAAQ
ncbi:hypothetical protein HDG32_007235 [Paraburkholderia sp. CI2]|uniref:hypothetical protein n=1 Tax=Paraburkholderia sp. CI2 TaxID=2723093 RepID=UPI00160A6E4D|nr:hypothetical protein [Paraburkholderia sp. CI2]MBB5471080.1 hypothetical protein [Paraburkholderia sp. CI2]